jgi:hypothetical protein
MAQAGASGLIHRSWLSLGLIEERGFAGPALVGEFGELFNLRLADEILLLLFDARGVFSDMS